MNPEKKEHKNLLILLAIGTLILYVFSLGLFSTAFAYFNTGASKKDILLEAEKGISDHTPIFRWIDNGNEGRKVEDYAKQRISSDYANAWYYHNLFHDQGHLENSEMFFANDKIKYFKKFEKINEDKKRKIERIDIEHNLDFHLYSLDGQIVSFTDTAALVIEKIRDENNQLSFVRKYRITQDVVMIYKDESWQIKHVVPRKIKKEQTQKNKTKKIFSINKKGEFVSNGIPFKSKGINYYPQHASWDMWKKFSTDTLQKDFKLIRSLGLNTVRIFVPFHEFGKGHTEEYHLQQLDSLLQIAQENNLYVIPTLFDFIHNYHLSNWAASDRQLEHLLNRYKNHPQILAWDIKNEPDLDFENHKKKDVLAWLEFMIERTKKYDPNHLITIGWSSTNVADLLGEHLDFISFHHYKDTETLKKGIEQIRKHHPNKVIMLGEFGQSTYNSFWFPFSKTGKEQEKYFSDILNTLNHYQGTHFLAWTLYDFEDIPNEIFSPLPWRKRPQKNYGIINLEGTLKPSAKILIDPEKHIATKNLIFESFRKPFYFTCLLILLSMSILFKIIKRIFSQKTS